MHEHSLFPQLQSAYRKNHSTETALLKIKNDILLGMNSQEVTLLVLADLSSAFDTIEHSNLLSRLQTKAGVAGCVLDWFKSYLTGRSQRVSVKGSESNKFALSCGVPQGSCLGPLLFSIYTSELFDVIEQHLPNAHCYADDTQIYFSFKAEGRESVDAAVAVMESCLSDMRSWMIKNRLLINDSKTEFLILGTRQQLQKVNIPHIRIGDADIIPTSHVTNLGVVLDQNLNMDRHISRTSKSAFFHLHNIRRISKYLDQESLLTLTHAFITSRLDYCNSLLYGAPVTQIEKLQRIQNAAARLITRSPKFCHMGPILRQLHWLPIRSRIHHKILTLTFKSIHGLAPSYLSELITTSRPSRYSLRSSQSTMLIHPPAKMLSTLGDRAFSTAAPQLWNRLPPALRNQHSFNLFKNQLKSYLFC